MEEKENQEPKKRVKAIHIDPKLCKGCELCIKFCPQNVLEKSKTPNEQGYYTPIPVNIKRCKACRQCELYCPEMSIFVEEES
ncbi:MAG: 4Fe-4S dicluster domain-containing protein [Candidatus Freyarchaeum deiterrae]